MSIHVRSYTDADRCGMTQFYRTAWHATYDQIDGAAAIDRVIAALLHGERPEMFVMPVGDVALVAANTDGFVGGIRGHPRDGALHLSGMYVQPGTHRRGIGTALFAALLQRFPHGVAVRADVRPTSVAARLFYARHGFIETGRGRTDVGGEHWVDTIELRRG